MPRKRKYKPRKPLLREIATVEGDVATAVLNRGRRVVLDVADLERDEIGGRVWTSTTRRDGRVAYVCRGERAETKSGKTTVYLHRAIVQPPRGFDVDHINGDVLDNRRCNLRIATPSQNQMNAGVKRANNTGFAGVQEVLTKSGETRYRAQIAVAVGSNARVLFKTLEEAVAWRRRMEDFLYGEYKPSLRRVTVAPKAREGAEDAE